MPEQLDHFQRTRIAPTPSGFLHLGNVLSFVITASLARKHGARILLRIDDLDRARANKNYLQDIFDTLELLEIPWDEGPRSVSEFESSYSQVHRMPLYRDAIARLCDEKLVFACTCSRLQLQTPGYACKCAGRELPFDAPDACLRLITHNAGLEVKNYPDQITNADLPPEMDSFIIRKKDGFPSYQLASVIDDLFFGTDLVVRGQDLWASTLAQLELAQALQKNNFAAITFHHHTLLTEASGKKLSKSAGATSVRYLRESGKTAAGIYTLIAGMPGLTGQASNWQQLAALMI